jgi:hypothetical protein
MNPYHDDPDTAELPTRRITITIDVIDEQGTDTTAITSLLDVLSHLENDGIPPLRIHLEIGPTQTT